MHKSIGYIFCDDVSNNEVCAERAPILRVIKDIYVNTEIVHVSLVSNTLANLFDVIPVMTSVGEVGVHRHSQPHYVRLHGGDNFAIEIRLCQKYGEKLQSLTTM